MGIFSSSYKYYAYAGSSSLFEDGHRPNTILQLMLNGIISGDATPAEAAIVGINTNLYARAKSMYRYAAKDGGYIFGFPTTNQGIYNITTTMLRPYIEAEAGGPIDFRTMHWGDFSSIDRRNFWLEKAISENYLNTDYFPWIPEIGDPLDTNWSPVDTTVEIPVENPVPGGSYWESSNAYDTVINGTTYFVSFPYDTPTQWWQVVQGFDLGSYNDGNIWIQVRYRMQGNPDQYLYWDYRIGSNDIPGLDAQITKASLLMNYLPIGVMMHDTTWFDEAGDQEWEDTLDRLFKDLALDPYDIKEEYLESITNPDPETPPDSIPAIEDIWDFFVWFGVPLKTNYRGGREYLFRFYEHLRANATWTTFSGYQDWLAAGALGDQPVSELVVEEGEEYTGFIARYAWTYITSATFPGTFTPPGWTDPLRPRRLWSDTKTRSDPDYGTWLELVHGDTFSQPGGGGTYLLGPSGKIDGQDSNYTFVVRMNSDNTHTFILMMAPSMEYQINTSQDPVGVGEGGYVDYRYRFVDCELFPDDTEESDLEFRWPVHIASLKEVSTMQREPALADGLCATVFLVDRVKVKWYQKGFFKWLIIIIVVIIVVLLWQYELLPSLAAAAGAATGATALALWALYIVLSFAIGFMISFAGSLIGGTWGQLFVIVAMFMAAGGSFSDFGGIPSSWSNLSTTPGWGSAIQFINAVSKPIQLAQQVYLAYDARQLEREMRDFIKTAKEKYEDLRDMYDSLQETPDWIDPLDLAQTFLNKGLWEDPESFYYRSLHANPGTLGYDLIQNFTDMAIMLPKNVLGPDVVELMVDQFARQRGQT